MMNLGGQKISSFYVGEEKIEKAYAGEVLVFGAGPSSRLPSGYTEVEYIQNSNINSYVNTKKRISASDFELIVSLPQGAPASNKYIFTASSGSNIYARGKSLSFLGDTISSGKYYTIYSQVSSEKMNISCKGTTITVNGTITTTAQKTYANDIIIPASDSASAQIIRIHYFKGKKSGSTSETYNFEMIPCINPNGVAGLYDLVSGEFVAPSGSFIAGPTV